MGRVKKHRKMKGFDTFTVVLLEGTPSSEKDCQKIQQHKKTQEKTKTQHPPSFVKLNIRGDMEAACSKTNETQQNHEKSRHHMMTRNGKTKIRNKKSESIVFNSIKNKSQRLEQAAGKGRTPSPMASSDSAPQRLDCYGLVCSIGN